MRVIAGKWKGRRLISVPGLSTRPTTDKVKESLFSMIGPFFDGGIGLDLFAGTGGLGIEALSRGMDRVIFIDRDGKAIETIHANIRQLKAEEQAEIYRSDADRALNLLQKKGIRFHLVLMDPPYAKEENTYFLQRLVRAQLLAPEAVVVVEREKEREITDVPSPLQMWKEHQYGDTVISIYRYMDEVEQR